MTTGLTLGKYAPLHRGHHYLIDTALREMDHLIVMIYDASEVTTVPLPVRRRWIEQLHPSVEVIEAWDGPTVVGDTPEIRHMHEQYLLQALRGRTITHFYSSEFYGDHVSRALGAIDRRVDPPRSHVPISATAIRRDPYLHRHYLDPLVYRDLITKVVLLGAPSTGKTTLAERLAERFNTLWMPEYGREYWEEHQVDRRLTPEQLVEIAEEHRHREDELITDANRYLFIDTDATTTFMFARYYHDSVHPRLIELADDTRDRYDLFLLCDDDIPYDDTWDRSGDVNRTTFQKMIRADLIERHIAFITVRGTIKERIATVVEILDRSDRFLSAGDYLRTPTQPYTWHHSTETD